ncbi:MAG: hypothetical protein JWN14_2112 [Chthonomonadales bacterium]|nr:hypothetical protein [Chthonomonadales bacterium]
MTPNPLPSSQEKGEGKNRIMKRIPKTAHAIKKTKQLIVILLADFVGIRNTRLLPCRIVSNCKSFALDPM